MADCYNLVLSAELLHPPQITKRGSDLASPIHTVLFTHGLLLPILTHTSTFAPWLIGRHS